MASDNKWCLVHFFLIGNWILDSDQHLHSVQDILLSGVVYHVTYWRNDDRKKKAICSVSHQFEKKWEYCPIPVNRKWTKLSLQILRLLNLAEIYQKKTLRAVPELFNGDFNRGQFNNTHIILVTYEHE